MKKLFSVLVLFVSMTLVIPNCKATDVWVAHSNHSNEDIYVMDETLNSWSSEDDNFFKISAKVVKNGQLREVINYTFVKHKSQMWRYRTDNMRNNYSVVIPKNATFEFCMNKLGRSYRIDGYYYY